MDRSQRTLCLPDTRVDHINSISEWVTSMSADNTLWVSGVAGAGKSTLVNTIADIYSELHRLGAYIYFSRDQATYTSPAHAVKTIASQLALFDSRLGSVISKDIDDDNQILDRSLPVQFDTLIANAVQAVLALADEGPIVIIIDALDECGTAADRKDFVRILSEKAARLPPSFRFIITSRPERDLETAFLIPKRARHHPLETDTVNNKLDVELFIRSRIRDIRMQVGPDWPGEERIQKLINLATGLFIWAFTACAFLEEYPTDERLDDLLKITALADLDQLYGAALIVAGDWKNDFARDCQSVLGLIVAARKPLSCPAIDALLQRPGLSTTITSRLKPVLHWSKSGPIRPLHASLSDYLTDHDRCKDKPWFIDLPSENHVLANLCIDLLSRELKENKMELALRPIKPEPKPDKPSELLDLSLPEATAYASASWIKHVCAVVGDSTKESLSMKVTDFLRVHLLHWVEAMSTLQQSRACVVLLGELLRWIPVSFSALLEHQYSLDFSQDIKIYESWSTKLCAFVGCLPTRSRTTLCWFTTLPFHSRQPKALSIVHFIRRIAYVLPGWTLAGALFNKHSDSPNRPMFEMLPFHPTGAHLLVPDSRAFKFGTSSMERKSCIYRHQMVIISHLRSRVTAKPSSRAIKKESSIFGTRAVGTFYIRWMLIPTGLGRLPSVLPVRKI